MAKKKSLWQQAAKEIEKAQKKSGKKTEKKTTPKKKKEKKAPVTASYGELVAKQNEAARKKNQENLKAKNKPSVTDVRTIKKAVKEGESRSALGTKIKPKTYSVDTVDKDGNKKKINQTYQDLTMGDYLQIQNVSRMPGTREEKNKLLGESLAKKVGAVNTASYAKGSFGQGLIEGVSPIPVHQNAVGSYTDDQKKIIDTKKQSLGYGAGYGLGMAANFALGGVGTVGSSLGATGIKAAAKGATKKAAKESAKKGVMRDATRNVDDVSKGVKFAMNRAGDAVASLPLNLADAIKINTDSDGNVTWEGVGKQLALNTALDVGIGSAVEGVGMALTKANGKKLIGLQEKVNAGQATAKDRQTLTKLYNKLETVAKASSEARSNIANDIKDKVGSIPKEHKPNIPKEFSDTSVSTIKNGVAKDPTTELANITAAVDKPTLTDVVKAKELANFYRDTGNVKNFTKADSIFNTMLSKIDDNGTLSSQMTGLYTHTDNGALSVAEQQLKNIDNRISEITEELKKPLSEDARGKLGRELRGLEGDKRDLELAMTREPDLTTVKTGADGLDPKANTGKGAVDSKPTAQTTATPTAGTRGGVGDIQPPTARDTADLQTNGVRNTGVATGGKATFSPQQISQDISSEIPNAPKVDTPTSNTPNIEAPTTPKADAPQAPKDTPNTTPQKEAPNNTAIYDAEVKAAKLKDTWQKSRDFEDLKKWRATEREASALRGETAPKIENPKVRAYNELPPKEKLKETAPDIETTIERAERGEITGSEISQHAYKLADQDYLTTEELVDAFIMQAKKGHFNKVKGVPQDKALADAFAQADEDVEKLYNSVMAQKDYQADTVVAAAERTALMTKLGDMQRAGEDVVEKMMKVMEKDMLIASRQGHGLCAQKIILATTNEGKLRITMQRIKRLNREFSDVLKGKELKITNEQAKAIVNAKTPEEAAEAMAQVNSDIWREIPATSFQKANEIRHFSMLFNVKTHARNLIGNMVFAGARAFSDTIEICANKIPAVQKKLASFGADPYSANMVAVTKGEKKLTNNYLEGVFNENYALSGGKNKYQEGITTTRPDDVSIFSGTGIKAVDKATDKLDKLIKFNYKMLDKEDMVIFKPEYKKAYVRWCKTHNIDLHKMSKMSPSQKQNANEWAMQQAKRATFRDDCGFSDFIIRLKRVTAEKKGKTAFGTAMYRTGNTALESVLPFVKTPINILRRSTDYSPIALARSTLKLTKAKSADAFLEGVHDLCTGLTGTGVMAVGMWLASKDLITVNAKDEDGGDGFFARDVGYQDYSLKVGGDKKYSVGLDWVAPMQVSFFTGAAIYDRLSAKGLSFAEMLNPFEVASTLKADDSKSTAEASDLIAHAINPMLDMSFMSSTKDALDMFVDRATRSDNGNPDWIGAIKEYAFGSMPQGYLSGFTPQLLSQTAQATDKYARDTRSTSKNTLISSWESFARKQANKIPILRQALLNPKIDRFGRKVVTIGGDNIFTRVVNAYLNPATTKKINLTDVDRELIDVYKKKEKDEDSWKFFYNFTGHPPYDLNNGKRMTYEELYEYGKVNRSTQYNYLKKMIDAKGYKNLTYGMKESEIDTYGRLSAVKADLDIYGGKYAKNGIVKGTNKSAAREKGVWKKYKAFGGDAKGFVEGYLKKEEVCNRAHDTDFWTKAVALAAYEADLKKKGGNVKQAKMLQKAYGVYGDKIEAAQNLIKANGGNADKALSKFTDAMSSAVAETFKNAVGNNKMNRSRAAADHDVDENTYYAMGYDWNTAQAGAGLKKYGYSLKQLEKMEAQALLMFDADNNNSLKKDEVMAYVNSLGLKSADEKACVFQYFSTANNPFKGAIDDHLKWNSTPPSTGGGGGGWGRRRGGGGGGRGGSVEDWETTVKNIFGNSTGSGSSGGTSTGKLKDYTSDSPLDEAYRKALKKRYNS